MQSVQNTQNGSYRRIVETALLVSAAALIAVPAYRGIARRLRARQQRAVEEPAIDKTLKDSFPASDPPAGRYFDIPVNRR
jgi:hypothetical protein